MYTFILVIHIIASFVLVGVILLQAGRGGGFAQTFGGGGASTTIFGQKASVFLTRATTVSAVLFLCTSLTLALLSSRKAKSLMGRLKIAPILQTGEQAIPTKTIKRVEVDPITGEERVVEEKVVPLTEEEIEGLRKKAEVPAEEPDRAK